MIESASNDETIVNTVVDDGQEANSDGFQGFDNDVDGPPPATPASTWKGCESDGEERFESPVSPRTQRSSVQVVIYTPSKTWIPADAAVDPQSSSDIEDATPEAAEFGDLAPEEENNDAASFFGDDMLNESDSIIVQTPKRGRGRPRKNTGSTGAPHLEETTGESSTTPKRRGRASLNLRVSVEGEHNNEDGKVEATPTITRRRAFSSPWNESVPPNDNRELVSFTPTNGRSAGSFITTKFEVGVPVVRGKNEQSAPKELSSASSSVSSKSRRSSGSVTSNESSTGAFVDPLTERTVSGVRATAESALKDPSSTTSLGKSDRLANSSAPANRRASVEPWVFEKIEILDRTSQHFPRDSKGTITPGNGTPATALAGKWASMGSSASSKAAHSLSRNQKGKSGSRNETPASLPAKRNAWTNLPATESSLVLDSASVSASLRKETPIPLPKPLVSQGTVKAKKESLIPLPKPRIRQMDFVPAVSTPVGVPMKIKDWVSPTLNSANLSASSKKESPILLPKPLARPKATMPAVPDERPGSVPDSNGKSASSLRALGELGDLAIPSTVIHEKDQNDPTPTPAAKPARTKRAPAKSPYFLSTPIFSELTPTSTGNKGEGEFTPKEPSTPIKNNAKAQPTPGLKKRSPAKLVSCIHFPPLSSPTFGLIQEKLADDPFRLLIAVTFLIQTPGKNAIPVFWDLMEKYPTPGALLRAETEDIVAITRHLGLQNTRAKVYKKYAQHWLTDPPVKGKRYAVPNYPSPDSGKGVKKDQVLPDGDKRDAWEIGHMTHGQYAIDSWRIFCRDKLRGEADSWNGERRGEAFQPEWMRVVPKDKELRAYLRWMWLKEGWEWDPFTGEKEVAGPELMRAAMEGRIAWDDAGGMRITVAPYEIASTSIPVREAGSPPTVAE